MAVTPSVPEHLPWMKLWVYDFIGKTVMWPGVAAGLYAQCLILEWASGPLPDDAAVLASILKYDAATFDAAWPIVRPAFESTADGRLVNPALEAERADAYVLRDKLSKGGKAGAEKSWSNRRGNSKANGPANGSPNGPANDQANALQHHGQPYDSGTHTHARVRTRAGAREPAHTPNPPDFTVTPERKACAMAAGLDPESTIKDFNERAKARQLPMTDAFFGEWCEAMAKLNAMDEPERRPKKHLNGSGQDVPK